MCHGWKVFYRGKFFQHTPVGHRGKSGHCGDAVVGGCQAQRTISPAGHTGRHKVPGLDQAAVLQLIHHSPAILNKKGKGISTRFNVCTKAGDSADGFPGAIPMERQIKTCDTVSLLQKLLHRSSKPPAAVLTPASDGELRALGLFTQLADVLVEVEIFDAWDNGPSGFLGSGNYTLDDIGYFQVELPESLTLKASDSIVVQLTYIDAETLDPALGALGITIAGSGLNFDIDTNTVADGLSYYLDGSAWIDFATIDYPFVDEAENVTGGVLFLKGITAVPEPSALLLLLAAAATLGLPRLVRHRKL
jgi:hypothetical protein